MMILELPRKLSGATAQVAESDAWRLLGLSRGGLSRFLAAAQAAVGLRGEVEVLLTSDRTLRRLNREFRGKDKATDVLSFPAAAFALPAGFPAAAESEAISHAGDLAISLEIAQAQAAEHGHSLRDEVRVLMLHGLLHLAGMDHETDRGEMAAREAALRRALRLPSGLIARTSAAPGVPRRASGRRSGAAETSRGSLRKPGAKKASGGKRPSGARRGSTAGKLYRGEA